MIFSNSELTLCCLEWKIKNHELWANSLSKPTCFCFCLACENKEIIISEGKSLKAAEAAFCSRSRRRLVVLTFTCRWRCGPPAPCYHVAQTRGVTSCFPAAAKTHWITTAVLWNWITWDEMKQLTFVSAPVWVALPPVAEGWGWKWCLLLLLLAGRSTSHYCTSVKFSTTAALGYTQHTSCFNVMKGCYWYLKQIFSLLWCARSLWHQSWLRLLGQDSPHPELHSNSHWSLLQMLQVWTVASTNKKNKETFQWWKCSANTGDLRIRTECNRSTPCYPSTDLLRFNQQTITQHKQKLPRLADHRSLWLRSNMPNMWHK